MHIQQLKSLNNKNKDCLKYSNPYLLYDEWRKIYMNCLECSYEITNDVMKKEYLLVNIVIIIHW
jgi:hypothetical protein